MGRSELRPRRTQAAGRSIRRSLGIDVLTDLHLPTLIVWGVEDRLLPLRSVEDFARIEGVRVELLQGCGHIPQLERPAATRRVVADFVRGLA